MSRCKLCEIYKEAGDPRLKKQIDMLIAGVPEKEKTSGSEYAGRLDVCASCEKLSGNTCTACGCFVELRAARKADHCVYKKW